MMSSKVCFASQNLFQGFRKQYSMAGGGEGGYPLLSHPNFPLFLPLSDSCPALQSLSFLYSLQFHNHALFVLDSSLRGKKSPLAASDSVPQTHQAEDQGVITQFHYLQNGAHDICSFGCEAFQCNDNYSVFWPDVSPTSCFSSLTPSFALTLTTKHAYPFKHHRPPMRHLGSKKNMTSLGWHEY